MPSRRKSRKVSKRKTSRSASRKNFRSKSRKVSRSSKRKLFGFRNKVLRSRLLNKRGGGWLADKFDKAENESEKWMEENSTLNNLAVGYLGMSVGHGIVNKLEGGSFSQGFKDALLSPINITVDLFGKMSDKVKESKFPIVFDVVVNQRNNFITLIVNTNKKEFTGVNDYTGWVYDKYSMVKNDKQEYSNWTNMYKLEKGRLYHPDSVKIEVLKD